MSDIPRIGRRASPGEGVTQLIHERPEVLDLMAFTHWANDNGLPHSVEAHAAWEALPEPERAARTELTRREAIKHGRAYDAEHPEPPDDSPDGDGQPLPIERIA